MSEYSDREVPLIPSALYGVRSFKIDENGGLHPLHRNGELEYTSGVHVAECKMSNEIAMVLRDGTRVFINHHPFRDAFMHPNTPAPQKLCTCGFYAYFEESPEKEFLTGGAFSTKVTGVVEATGRTIVGSKGFRAEKMKIVGLVCDYSVDKLTIKQRIFNFMLSIGEGFANIATERIFLGFALVYWTMIVASIAFGNPTWLDIPVQCLNLIMYSFLLVSFVTVIFMFSTAKRIDKIEFDERPEPGLSKKIQKKYPDVKFFSSLDDAKKHFSMTKASDIPT